MKRSRDVVDNQVVDPPLNLPLTISSELINSFETCLGESYTCSSQQTSSSNTSTPPKKLKALNFPISKITIGDWTYDATNPEDIVAKFYFAKKKLLWEFLGHAKSETNKRRLKIKIEMQWEDVLSFQGSFNSRDNTGILKIELKKRPTFFEETNPQPGKHTQWKQLDSDFTSDRATRCRIHTLHFQPEVLQKNLEKLMSISFWSELCDKVRFPSQEGIYFDDIDYGSNNNNAINNSSGHIPSQTPRFYAHSNQHLHSQANSLNNTANEFGTQAQPGTYLVGNSNQHLHSQGIIREGVGEGNFYSATTQSLDNDGWQNSCSQANSLNYTANEFGTQAQPGTYLAGNSNQHLHSQGIIREGVGEGNFYSATTQSLDNDGWQNSCSQANSLNYTANEFGTQAQPGTYLAGNSNQHLHSQGIVREGVGEGNFYSATQSLDNDGWQNSCSQANSLNYTANEFGTEPPPGSYLAGLILDEEMHTTLRLLEKCLMSDDSTEIEDDSNGQDIGLCRYMDQFLLSLVEKSQL